MNDEIIVDGDRTPKEPIFGENKGGDRTINGKSAKQMVYQFKRRYGEDKYKQIMGTLDEGDPEPVDK
jgi:hypothetical protein